MNPSPARRRHSRAVNDSKAIFPLLLLVLAAAHAQALGGSPFDTDFSAMQNLFTPSVDGLGLHMVVALVTIMLVWFGVQEARASAQGGPGPGGLAAELLRWKLECKDRSPEAFIFPNADGGFIDTASYRFRFLKPLAQRLGIQKMNFQILRRTMATQAQRMGSVRDIQAHLRHAQPDTAAHEYMQELPESVQEMVDQCTRCSRKERTRRRDLCVCYQMPREPTRKSLILWWALQDSNLRLPPCEDGTLPLS
jgi:hypothetical protein